MDAKALKALEAKALELTKTNVQKGRSARTGSYLSRFVKTLNGVGEKGGLTRLEIISKISVSMLNETYEGNLDFENPEHVEAFGVMNKKVKAQVAAAISDSQNNTSLSFNPTTKDKYELHRSDSERGEIYWITEKAAE